MPRALSYFSKVVFLWLLALRLGLLYYPDGNYPICTFLQNLLFSPTATVTNLLSSQTCTVMDLLSSPTSTVMDLLSSPPCSLMDILVVAIGVHLAVECLQSCFTFSFGLNLWGIVSSDTMEDVVSTVSSVLMVLSAFSLLHLLWVFKIVRLVWVEDYFIVIQVLHLLLVAVIALQTAIQGVYLVCAQCAHLSGRLTTVVHCSRDRFGYQMKLQAFFNVVFGVYTVSLLVITRTSEIKLENYEFIIFSVCACGQVLYRACCVGVECRLAQTHTPAPIVTEEPIQASEDPPALHEVGTQATGFEDDQSTRDVRASVAGSDVITFIAEPVEAKPPHELLSKDKADRRTVTCLEPQRKTTELVCLALSHSVQNQAQRQQSTCDVSASVAGIAYTAEPPHELPSEDEADRRTVNRPEPQRETTELVCLALSRYVQNLKPRDASLNSGATAA